MLSLLFPTGKTPNARAVGQELGSPVPASPCRGHHTVLIDGTCLFCGHYDGLTIASTWARRARELAAR